MPIRFLKHIRSNAVAYLALFFALSGASYAAWMAPANSVNSQAIIDGQVTAPDLASGAVAADGFCLYGGCWGSREIADNAVATSELAGGAVTSSKIASAAVTSSRIATGAVGSTQVQDGSLTSADIQGGLHPIAWGSVGSYACGNNGICQLDVNHGVASVRRIDANGATTSFAGVAYCVAISGASPGTHPIIATSYHLPSGNAAGVVSTEGQYRSKCASNEFEVETDELADEIENGSTVVVRHVAQYGFSFAVI